LAAGALQANGSAAGAGTAPSPTCMVRCSICAQCRQECSCDCMQAGRTSAFAFWCC
jgi:hypothetical protein